jgi:hypothetical protein
MLSKEKRERRAKSAMAKTDCFLLMINEEAFEILIRERLYKE